jgi:hypothetical protein
MPAVTDYANEAAAIAAGWKKQQVVTNTGVFVTHFERIATGAGNSGQRQVATGSSTVSAAAADVTALAALQAQRRHYFGGAPGRASGDGDSPSSRNVAHSIDVT